MNNANDIPQGQWLEHTERILKKIPHARYYAMPYGAKRAIAANLATWWKEYNATRHEGFTDTAGEKFLREFLAVIPGAFQKRPAAPVEQAQVEKLIDPVTGLPVQNPWAKETLDVTSQNLLAKHFPQWSEQLKQIASGKRNAAAVLAERLTEDTNKLVRELEYDHERHARNPFANGADRLQREDFIRNHPEHVTKFYQDETAPVVIPWHPTPDRSQGNLTAMMRLAKEKPELRAVIDKAIPLERAWAREDLARLHQDSEKTRAMRESAEALLAPAPAPAART